jgi:hypothetical protein
MKGRKAGYQPPRAWPLPIHGSEKREGPDGYQVMAFQPCPDWLRDPWELLSSCIEPQPSHRGGKGRVKVVVG